METDLDHDDAIGIRMRALHEWAPAAPNDESWRVIEARRRRRSRRVAIAAGAAFVVTGLVVALAVAATEGSTRRVEIVTPPPTTVPPVARVLPALGDARLRIEPPGPYQANQSARVSLAKSYADALPFDAANNGVQLCFEWAAGELCDPGGQGEIGAQTIGTDYVWTFSMPGWVRTPAGLLPCARVRCRIEIDDHNHRVATTTLDITAGPQPVEPVQLTSVARDGTLALADHGLVADPSWSQWSRSVEGTNHSDLPAGSFNICAFGVGCDAIVYPAPPAFDGRPHDLVVPTNRLILTPEGWIDCARVTCYVAIWRTIDVIPNGQAVGGSSELIGVVPYRLPGGEAPVSRPTLTIDDPAPHVGDTFTATLRDPPPHVDLSRMELAQCNAVDLRLVEDCTFSFGAGWKRAPDGSLRQEQKVFACRDSRPPCYVAVLPAAKGYPEIARTARFPASP